MIVTIQFRCYHGDDCQLSWTILQGCDAEEKYTAKMLAEKLDRQSLIGASPLTGNVKNLF